MIMSNEKRLDIYLVDAGFFSSRAKAQQAIKDQLVYHRETRKMLTKPSLLVTSDTPIEIIGETLPYVSRGGLKLAAAVEYFDIICTNKIALDIGASTGGFTDCLLQKGASLVYALDVGTEQLDLTLRNNPQVVSFEQTNFRYVEASLFSQGLPNLIVTDVSFISLTYILDKIATLFTESSFEFVGLIKPQFELDKQKVGKKGIVHDKKMQQMVIDKICHHIEGFIPQWQIVGVIDSPITGNKGNHEFLIYAKKESGFNLCRD